MTRSTEESALDAMRRRTVDSQFSHLWSDALFAREQARNCAARRDNVAGKIASIRQEKPELAEVHISHCEAEVQQIAWDLGSYVRWTIVTAWMAFERAAGDATGDRNMGRNVSRNLPKALSVCSKEDEFWQTQPWSNVRRVHMERKKLVHKDLSAHDLFPAIQVAEEAISSLRDGIIELGYPVDSCCVY